MNSTAKFINIKVVERIKIYNFYFSHFFVRQERDINLWTMYTTTLPYEEITKIKVVDLEKLHNFIVDNLWFEIILLRKIMLLFLKFEIWIFKASSNREMITTKVVDLKKLCNFVVDNFFIWNHLVKESYVWISHIWNLNF
jgi:hypothetical protein